MQDQRIPLRTKNMDEAVIDLIYDKQLIFKKEKKRVVSLDYTINRLLKEAYLRDDKKKPTQ
jgi:hypothetical protein